jgi:hypothetical protein
MDHVAFGFAALKNTGFKVDRNTGITIVAQFVASSTAIDIVRIGTGA